MFDISSVNKRFMEVNIEGATYKIEPCKVKTMKKMSAIDRSSDDALDTLTSLVKEIIDKNIDNKKIASDKLDDLSIDELFGFITAYMEWLSGIQSSPNL